MHRIGRVLLVLSALSLFAAAAGPACAAIPWIKDDFDSAQSEAKVRKRPLLIYFHTTWCSWCAQMEDKVFSDDEVTFQANAFVALRLNCDRREGQKLMKQYHVTTFPTVLAVTVDHQVLGRLGMYRSPAEFIAFLQDCQTPSEMISTIDERIDKAGADAPPDLLLKSAAKHYDAGEPDVAAKRYTQAIAATKPPAEAGADAHLGLGQVKALKGDAAGALEQYTIVLKDYPASKRLGEAFVGALFLLREENKGSEIDALFEQFAGRFPDDPSVLNDHARRLLDSGKDPALALTKAQRAVALRPDSVDSLETLAKAWLANGHPNEALEAVTKAVELRPNDKDLRLLRLETFEAAQKAPAAQRSAPQAQAPEGAAPASPPPEPRTPPSPPR